MCHKFVIRLKWNFFNGNQTSIILEQEFKVTHLYGEMGLSQAEQQCTHLQLFVLHFTTYRHQPGLSHVTTQFSQSHFIYLGKNKVAHRKSAS